MNKLKDDDYSEFKKNEKRLFELAAKGDMDARAQIITNYIPLVHSCVNKHILNGVPKEDLIQEGCYGLILAVDRYNHALNTAFSTFAYYYINKFVKKALIELNTFHYMWPDESLYYDIKTYLSTFNRFIETHKRSPSDEELAALLKLSPLQFQRIKTCIHEYVFSQNVEEGAYNKAAFATAQSAEDAVLQNLDIADYNASLTKREEEIIRRRFGFAKSDEPESWAQISAEMNLSFNTIKRAYLTGVKKLEQMFDKLN